MKSYQSTKLWTNTILHEIAHAQDESHWDFSHGIMWMWKAWKLGALPFYGSEIAIQNNGL